MQTATTPRTRKPRYAGATPLALVALAAALSFAQPSPARSETHATATAFATALAPPVDFSAMVAEKLPAVVGILSTAAAPDESATGPRLPPGLDEFFGNPRHGGPKGGPELGPEGAPAPGRMQALGSGFVISSDGFIVTNNHVIADARDIEVIFADGAQSPATLVGTDPATDIALLKIDGASGLPAVEWGDSDAVKIGQWLIAIGNPFGLGGTVTAGILSARSRDIRSGPYDDFLQTDAAINSGNSGGPLFDAAGQVVGVNTAIFSPTGGSVGIGFAVPSDVARNVVDQLRATGRVERGWLGVQLQPLTDDLVAALGAGRGLDGTKGALIAEVTAGSPAAQGGLKAGDVITRVGDQTVTSPREASFAVAGLAAGTKTPFRILRDGSHQDLTVEIGARPMPQDAAAAATEPPDGDRQLGLSLAPLDGQLREQLGIDGAVSGLVVAGVASGSVAARAGIRRGDVIVEAGGTAITAPADLSQLMAGSADGDRPILLRIYRNGGYAFVPVPRPPR